MEDLTKTQIILVCLLVSFVTSIGTGIITASLLQEAPQSVTQTINRVVERTVEKVVPQGPGTTEIKEVTVVVKEEDLVIDAIEKNNKSLVRIMETGPSGEVFYGIGLVLKSDGTILADRRRIVTASSYTARFFDNKVFPLRIMDSSGNSSAVFFSVVKDNRPYEIFPAVIGNSDNVQLGQTVIAIGGKERNVVSIGRATGVVSKDGSQGDSLKTILSIETDTVGVDMISGSLLLNLNGEVVGLRFPDPDQNKSIFTAINTLKKADSGFFALATSNGP